MYSDYEQKKHMKFKEPTKGVRMRSVLFETADDLFEEVKGDEEGEIDIDEI